jgi:hypothetical protein
LPLTQALEPSVRRSASPISLLISSLIGAVAFGSAFAAFK